MNARALTGVLSDGGISIVSGGTDSHLVLVDLRSLGITGKAELALEAAGFTCNKNAIPFDPQKLAITSGIRLGTSAATTRGFGEREFRKIGSLILETLKEFAGGRANETAIKQVAHSVRELCRAYPIYPAANYL